MEDPNFNPNFKVNGRGYLHFLAEAGAARVMKRLVQMGCSVREYDDEGVAPVHIAAAAGHLLCLKLVFFFFFFFFSLLCLVRFLFLTQPQMNKKIFSS